MIVKSVKLKNYNRLYVSGISEIEYTPIKKRQILLGKNGSGKSSLLKEIIPNTISDKIDYDEGGYKEIIYEHKNILYTLKYDRDSNKYSFIVGKENLNPSGLLKIQKQLIEDHFNLSKEVHELLTSETSFTTMSINDRKKWFTTILTNVDYKYALSIYNKSKVRHRDLLAYIKLTKAKVISDQSLLDNMDKDKESSIRNSIKILNVLLEQLIEAKEPYVAIDLDNRLNQITIISKELHILETKLYTSNIDIPNLNNILISKEANIAIANTTKLELQDKLSKVNDLNINEGDDKVAIQEEFNIISKELEALNNDNIYKLDLNTILDTSIDFKNILTNLIEITTELKQLEEYFHFDFNHITELVDNLKLGLQGLNSKHTLLVERIEVLDKAKEHLSTCPKCDHSWIPNFDKVTYDNYIKDLKILNVNIDDSKTRLLKYEEQLKNAKDVKQYRDAFRGHFNINTNKLLGAILRASNGLVEIDTVIPMFNQIEAILARLTTYPKVLAKHKELSDKLEIFKKLNNDTIKSLLNNLDTIQTEYSNTINKINALNTEISNIRNISTIVNKVKILRDKLDNELKGYNSDKKEYTKSISNKFLSETINDLKIVISEEESSLIEITTMRKRYDSYVLEVKDYERRAKAMGVVVEYISPNKGIIGKSITNTINVILEDMNDIINEVWSYPMYILPSDIDGDDLTFKFPVGINNVKTIPDISKGSSGIRDIIDLAFKIVAIEYLDMLDYPLILDEFGNTMDPGHRINAYDFIDKVSGTHFTQIFLVAHFQSMFSRFKDTDVSILNNDGIGYNENYNEILKIK